MSFAAEMKDFFSAFQTTSSVASDIRTRRDKRKENEDLFADFEGPQALTPQDLGYGVKNGKDGIESEKADKDNGDDIEVDSTLDERDSYRKPDGRPMGAYALGGPVKLRFGTQKGRQPLDMRNVNKRLIEKWEQTQEQFGRSLPIVSAYRDPKRNKKAGGAKKSQHLHGNAFDIDVSSLSKPERLELIKIASANGFTGIGVYNNSLHFDLGNRRSWGPTHSDDSIPGWAKPTIDAHLAGKLGGYSRPATTPNREAEYETASGPTSALPVDTADVTSEGKDSILQRLRDNLRNTDDEETPRKRYSYGGYDDRALPEYDTEGIDISAIDVPQPRPYVQGDLTATPQASYYAAAGGSVPEEKPDENMLRYERAYTPDYAKFISALSGGVKMYADGGAIGDETEDAAPVVEPASSEEVVPPKPRPRPTNGPVTLGKAIDLGLKYLMKSHGLSKEDQAVGDSQSRRKAEVSLMSGTLGKGEPPPTPQEMKQVFKTVDPDNRLNESLRTIYGLRRGVDFYYRRGEIDKAEKFAAGLIQYSNLVARQYGVEAVQAAKAGDMNGMIELSVKAYNAIPDGYDVSAKPDKNGILVTRTDEQGRRVDVHRLTPQQVLQMATGISQGSGYFEALMDIADPSDGSARKAALTTEGNAMVYDDIKDHLSENERKQWDWAVQNNQTAMQDKLIQLGRSRAEKAGGDAKNKGKAEILTERFAPVAQYASVEEQNAFKKAIENGQFEIASDIIRDAQGGKPKPKSASELAAERKAESEKRRVEVMKALYPDLKRHFTPEEDDAWNKAVAAGDAAFLDDLKDEVKARVDKSTERELRRAEKEAERAARAKEKAEDRAIRNKERQEDRAYTDEKFDRQQEAIDTRMDRRDEAAATKELEKRKRQVASYNRLYGDYEPSMTQNQKDAWATAVEENDPDALKLIIEQMNSMGLGPSGPTESEQESAIPEPKKSWLSDSWLTKPWSEQGYGPQADQAEALTPQSNAGKPMPPEVLLSARKALSEGKSRAGVIQRLREKGYNPAGL